MAHRTQHHAASDVGADPVAVAIPWRTRQNAPSDMIESCADLLGRGRVRFDVEDLQLAPGERRPRRLGDGRGADRVWATRVGREPDVPRGRDDGAGVSSQVEGAAVLLDSDRRRALPFEIRAMAGPGARVPRRGRGRDGAD
jgi:hypothetical protein